MTDAETRELEAAVAKAMGWRCGRLACRDGVEHACGQCGQFGHLACYFGEHSVQFPGVIPSRPCGHWPRYLSDPVAAWAALEWLLHKHPEPLFVHYDRETGEHSVNSDTDDLHNLSEVGETLAEAVCRAVVAAAGGE